MKLGNGQQYRFVVEDGEEPIILGSDAAGFNLPNHWVTMTTTKDIRELHEDMADLSRAELRAEYRALSLEVITQGKIIHRLRPRAFKKLHRTFARWAVTRQELFQKDLPISSALRVVDRIQV